MWAHIAEKIKNPSKPEPDRSTNIRSAGGKTPKPTPISGFLINTSNALYPAPSLDSKEPLINLSNTKKSKTWATISMLL